MMTRQSLSPKSKAIVKPLILIPALLLLFAAVACESDPSPEANTTAKVTIEELRPLLNSERIERKFGSYGIDVLRNDDAVRMSNLYSLRDGEKICRTFAVVLFPDELDPTIAAEHKMISGGQSIGAVFKENGWSVTKYSKYFGLMAVTPRLRGVLELMGNINPLGLAVYMYDLEVKKGNVSAPYATISEFYHPGFLKIEALEKIYGEEFRTNLKPDSLTQQTLGVVMTELAKAAPVTAVK